MQANTTQALILLDHDNFFSERRRIDCRRRTSGAGTYDDNVGLKSIHLYFDVFFVEIFERFGDRTDKTGAIGAVDHAMIIRK